MSDRQMMVRQVLADRLGCLFPDLDGDEQRRCHMFVALALERASRDRVAAVGAALASALRDVARYSAGACRTLGAELRRMVADRMLECFVTISDADLADLVAAVPRLAPAPDDGEGRTGRDRPPAGLLLDNRGRTLQDPPVAAPRLRPAMTLAGPQEPPALSPYNVWLSAEVRQHLVTFIERAVCDLLGSRPDLPGDTISEVAAVMRRRLDWRDDRQSGESPAARARRMQGAGSLDEAAIGDALAWFDLKFVRAALGLLAQVTPDVVDGIFAAQDAKGVTALAWRAGLSMRCAMHLQLHAAKVPPRLLLNARGGTDYPLTLAEMTWQLGLYGA